jgi:hypothetical protein
MPRALLVFLLLAGAAGAAHAQFVHGTVSGVVQDEQLAPLPGLTVTLTSSTGARTTVTDDRGRYRFNALPPGEYTLTAGRAGQAAGATAPFHVPPGRSLEVPVQVPAGNADFAIPPPTGLDRFSPAVRLELPSEVLATMPLARANPATDLLDYLPGINDQAAYGAEAGGGNGFFLDGADTRDPDAGSAWTLLTYGTIGELSAAGPGATAEHGGFLGVLGYAAAKSGANRRAGLVEVRFSSDSLTGDNLDDEVLALNPELGVLPEVTADLDVTAQLGGPFARDRAFYFASLQFHAKDQDPVGPVTSRSERAPRVFFKPTWQFGGRDRIDAFVHWETDNQDGGAGLAGAESTDDQTLEQSSPGVLWSARWTRVLGQHAVLDATYSGLMGHLALDPALEEPARYDGATGTYYAGGAGYSARYDRSRHQGGVSLTRYAEGFGGTHAFRFGLEAERSHARNQFDYTDGLVFIDEGGRPYLAYSYSYDVGTDNTRVSAYAQDAWQRGRLTATLGARFDYLTGAADGAGTVYSPSPMAAPRLGVAWDLTSRAATLLKATWGWYYDQAISNPYYRASPGRSDLIGYQVLPGDRLVQVSSQAALLYSVDDDIAHPRTDEATVSFEHALGRDVRFTAAWVYRNTRDTVGSVLPNARWTPIVLVNGLDGSRLDAWRLSTRPPAFAPGDLLITNPDEFTYATSSGDAAGPVDAARQYSGVLFTVARPFRDRWGARVSYVWSRSTGTVSTLFGATTATSVYETPSSALVNADGPLEYDRTHEVKAFASYQVPWIDVELHAVYRGLSGRAATAYQRYSRSTFNLPDAIGSPDVWLEARGSRRADFTNLLDVRVEKTFGVGAGRIGLYADVLNVLNAAAVTARQTRYPGGPVEGADVAFDAPIAVQPPWQVIVGGRWSY